MNLFDTVGFVPKLHCGTAWTNSLVAFDVIANALIIIGYITLSVRLYRAKLFLVFPLFCALARIGMITAYWWAPYRLYAVLNWVCVIAIGYFIYHLRPILDKYELLITQEQINRALEEEIRVRERAQQQLQLHNKTLIIVIDRLETVLKGEIWIYDRRRAIEELDTILQTLSKANEQ